jgi:hypothetical protein
MAVDSAASVVGGRQNWSLPKTLASFDGLPGAGEPVAARGPGWTMRASARVIGPTLPVRTGGRIVQRWPDGQIRTTVMRAAGRLRPAVVTLEVQSDGELPAWLRPGRHLGAVIPAARFSFPPAR